MNPEEITRQMIGEDCNDEIDFKSLNNHWVKQKRRKVERNLESGKNIKRSKEASKTVTFRLHKKLIERGRTSNLNANFYAKACLHV